MPLDDTPDFEPENQIDLEVQLEVKEKGLRKIWDVVWWLFS